MPSNKPRLATYTTKDIIDKFHFIADYERRSASKELEFIVMEYIKHFESNNGELILDDNGNMTIAKPKLEGKSSDTKIG